MRLGGIRAYPYYLITLLFEKGKVIAEIAGFNCTNRRIVLRIEVEDYLLAFVVVKGYGFAILIFGFNGGGLIPYLQSYHALWLHRKFNRILRTVFPFIHYNNLKNMLT